MNTINSKIRRVVFRELSRVRHGLIPLMIFTILLGLVNLLVINQKIVLYIFYIPVIFAAWVLPKREAVGIATLAAVLVAAYVFFLPEALIYSGTKLLLWAELTIWSGIMVVTAYMVSTLRIWTEDALRNLEQAYSGVLAILSRFIQTVDADTEAHCVRVSALSVHIGRELGLDRALTEEIRIAALLHDVGKIDVSVEILRKTAALSTEERENIREHPVLGAAMIKPIGGMLAHIADAIEAHHENYDGSGHNGLKGDDIPVVARVIAVSDVFDALLSDRPYRKGIGILKAMDNIITSSGSKFDPMVVAALQNIVNHDGEQTLVEILETADKTSPSVRV